MIRDILSSTINLINRRKDVRIGMRAKICAFGLIKYDPKTDLVECGTCRVLELRDIGPSGAAVRHDDILKKGDLLEFRTRYSIENKDCIKCLWFPQITDALPIREFIGRVIWRSNTLAGLSFIMIHEKDRAYLKKLVSGAFDKERQYENR